MIFRHLTGAIFIFLLQVANTRNWETAWLAAITERVFLTYLENLHKASLSTEVSLIARVWQTFLDFNSYESDDLLRFSSLKMCQDRKTAAICTKLQIRCQLNTYGDLIVVDRQVRSIHFCKGRICVGPPYSREI